MVGRQKQPRSGLIIPPCNHKLINTRPCWITGGGEGIHLRRCALMKRNNLKATRWSARGVRRRGRLRCLSTSSREGSPRQSWPLVKNHYVLPSLRELLPNSDEQASTRVLAQRSGGRAAPPTDNEPWFAGRPTTSYGQQIVTCAAHYQGR